MKESFILYTSFYEPLKYLTNEQLGRLFKAIFEFNINGTEEVESDIQIAFAFIKNQINVDSKKYEETKKKKAEAGKKGMQQRWKDSDNITEDNKNNNVKNVITNVTNITDNDNVNENVNVNDNENENDINNIAPSETDVSTSDTAKASKHKYGEYKHVLLKDEELQALKRDFSNWEELIKYLDEYIEMKGYKAKSHYLAIRKWVVDAVKRNSIKNSNSNIKNTLSKEEMEEFDRRMELKFENEGLM